MEERCGEFTATASGASGAFDLFTITPSFEDYHGMIAVNVSVDDGGLSGAGGSLVGSATETLVVRAVNDAPTISIGGVAGDVGGWSIMEGGMSAYGDLVVTSSDAADGLPDVLLSYVVSVDEGASLGAGRWECGIRCEHGEWNGDGCC